MLSPLHRDDWRRYAQGRVRPRAILVVKIDQNGSGAPVYVSLEAKVVRVPPYVLQQLGCQRTADN